MSAGQGLTVACVKWGTKFSADYVNVLRRAVAEHLRRPHRFLCMTDDAAGLDPEVETRPFPDFGLERKLWSRNGNWGKLGLFAPGQFPDEEVLLYLDLDVFVLGGLDPIPALVEREGGFHHLEDFPPILLRRMPRRLRPDQGGQGSVLAFRMGEQRGVFEAFRTDPKAVVMSARGDRSYWAKVVRNPRYLPERWCVSFKDTCVWTFPLNHLLPPRKPPPDSKVLVFHGKPRPIDLMRASGARWGSKRRSGTEPVPWVREYWTGYGGALPET